MFVIVDLETTGLDARKDLILELGIGIYADIPNEHPYTDPPFALYESIIPTNIPELPMSSVVRTMHINSGLIEELGKAFDLYPVITTAQVEQAAIDFLESWDAIGEPMTGSTINFDRAFLQQHMPRLESTFDYHNFDVSTLRGLTKKFRPSLMDESPPDQKKHRVKFCIEDTAAQLYFHLGHLFP